MPAQSDVSICNLALTRLSSSTIENLTDDSENARKCNAVYSFIRDNMLANHNWNFATKEAELADTGNTPELEDWNYIYQLPSDCLRVIKQEDDLEFKVFEDTLYNNDSTSKIRYIAQITDPTAFPVYFAKALAGVIAGELAFGITQNASLAEGYVKIGMQELKEAKWSDSQEGEGERSIRSSLIQIRGK